MITVTINNEKANEVNARELIQECSTYDLANNLKMFNDIVLEARERLKEEVIEIARNGFHTLESIAEMTGLSKGTVHRTLHLDTISYDAWFWDSRAGCYSFNIFFSDERGRATIYRRTKTYPKYYLRTACDEFGNPISEPRQFSMTCTTYEYHIKFNR